MKLHFLSWEKKFTESTSHNMTNESALKVLANIQKAMGPSSRILISQSSCQWIVKEIHFCTDEYRIQSTSRVPHNEKVIQAPAPLLPNFGVGRIRTHYLDMTMMVLFNSEERTLEDYIELVEMSGLNLVKVWDLGETILLELALA